MPPHSKKPPPQRLSFGRVKNSSYHRAIQHDRPFRNDDDAVADDEILALGVLDLLLIDDADIGADTGVLVEDGVFDDGAGADAEVGDAAALVVGDVGRGL